MRWRSLFFICLFFISPLPVFASSSYVLPYPSEMPGSRFYNVNLVIEKVSKFWHFGNLAQFKYNLSMSDKYLVEAKTLFEYRQYLLGAEALGRSNEYFLKTRDSLSDAREKGQNTSGISKIIQEASLKHVEVLSGMKINTPTTFNWKPEKENAIFINLHTQIDRAISIRNEN